MSSLRELHSELDEALNINTDDSVLDYRYYTQLINNSREVALRNELNRNRTIDDKILSSYCESLEEVSPATCCNITLPTTCTLIRTKTQLPELIELHHTDGLVNILPAKITLPKITVVTMDRVPYLGFNRVTKNLIYAFRLDGYLYIYSSNKKFNLLENIYIRGLFADPTELANYKDCQTGSSCFDLDGEYPISRWMWESIVKPYVLQQLANKLGIPLDEENNAKDEKKAIPKEGK